MVKFSKNFDFVENFRFFRKVRKISILVKIFEKFRLKSNFRKNFDFGQIFKNFKFKRIFRNFGKKRKFFVKFPISVKFSNIFDFSQICEKKFDFGQNFRQISIFVKFSKKISIFTKIFENFEKFRFYSNYRKISKILTKIDFFDRNQNFIRIEDSRKFWPKTEVFRTFWKNRNFSKIWPK